MANTQCSFAANIPRWLCHVKRQRRVGHRGCVSRRPGNTGNVTVWSVGNEVPVPRTEEAEGGNVWSPCGTATNGKNDTWRGSGVCRQPLSPLTMWETAHPARVEDGAGPFGARVRRLEVARP